MRVKFIASPDYNGRGRIINPAYWFLRSYYKFASKNYNKIHWVDTHFDYITDNQIIIDKILEEKVDILCMSIYLWNKDQYLTIAKKVKEKNPKIIVVAGGPELDAYKNATFWQEHEVLDYVVYGDGELAFKFLLDHIVAGESLENAVNLVTKEKTYPFQIFSDPIFSTISPYLEMKEDIIRVVNEAKEYERLCFNWEMSRGCPYECSFCDWSSGLHTKVKRRKGNWKEEIDLFAELGVQIAVIDANWGIFKEDMEIHQYAVDKLGEKYFTTNYSKLNKKAVYEMVAIQSKARISIYKPYVSLQDINPEVLRNINRPEIPWDEHKTLIKEIIEKNPNIQPLPELVIGLPGQTIDSIIDTITELYGIGIKSIMHHPWVILTNSPAAKKEYQEKYKIKIDEIIMIANTINFEDKQAAKNSYANKDDKTFKIKTVVGTYSCNLTDILTMHSMISLYNAIMQVNSNLKPLKIINANKSKLTDLSHKHAIIMEQDKIFGIQNENSFVDYGKIWEQGNFNLAKALKDI